MNMKVTPDEICINISDLSSTNSLRASIDFKRTKDGTLILDNEFLGPIPETPSNIFPLCIGFLFGVLFACIVNHKAE